jgi:hypothetical protein
VTRLISKGDAQYLREGFIAEGLTQSWAVAKAGGKRLRAISGCKDEGNATLLKHVRHGKNHRSTDIDVEDTRIKVGVVSHAEGFVQLSGWANNFTAKIEDHILYEHRYHRFVLNDEDATTGSVTHAKLRRWAGHKAQVNGRAFSRFPWQRWPVHHKLTDRLGETKVVS